MKLIDVRRLTGANLILDRPGAAGEAIFSEPRDALFVLNWRKHARAALDAVGWTDEIIRVRPYSGGATLAFTAPMDALYTATDILEWAWAATTSCEGPSLEQATPKFIEDIAQESNPTLKSLHEAALAHSVTFLSGEDSVSLGLGIGGQSWPEDSLPNPSDIEWPAIRDIPLALVTGTNGKSTTVRLTAAIGAAAGHTVGQCSSDWVRVGDELIDEGDYSGPAGARLAVRDPRSEMAVLEVARGGLMRRGLSFPRADACLITNIAADHLGDYGITDVSSLADAKFLLAKTVENSGRLILNADAPELVKRGCAFSGDIAWFSLDPETSGVQDWAASGGTASFLKDGQLILARGGVEEAIIGAADFPLSMGGVARYNIANALGAILLSATLGLSVAAMRDGLMGFRSDRDDNPGRGNFLEVGGVRMLIDFAHNPHGTAAVLQAVAASPAKRRLAIIGQAGDRRDEDIRDMTRIIWNAGVDAVVVKELPKALRGRALGAVPAIIHDELKRIGAPPDAILDAPDEMSSLKAALNWAEEGDFLLLFLHSERKAAMALLDKLAEEGWRAGDPV